MKSYLSESLQPVVEALAPTEFGPPKAQPVISKFLKLFEQLIVAGYTYEQMAEALTAGGARGRRGAQFSGNSLSSYIARARKGAAVGGPAEIRVRPSETTEDIRTASTSVWDQDREDASALGVFSQSLRAAHAHAAMNDLLFNKARKS